MLSVLKVEFEKLFRTKSFWIVLAFLSLITSAVAVTRSVSLLEAWEGLIRLFQKPIMGIILRITVLMQSLSIMSGSAHW